MLKSTKNLLDGPKRSDDLSYEKFVQKLKSETLDIRDDREKFQSRKENTFEKSFNTHERRLINAGFNINQVRALTAQSHDNSPKHPRKTNYENN